MRLMILIRFAFLALLITSAALFFWIDSTFCVAYRPTGFEKMQTKCEAQLKKMLVLDSYGLMTKLEATTPKTRDTTPPIRSKRGAPEDLVNLKRHPEFDEYTSTTGGTPSASSEGTPPPSTSKSTPPTSHGTPPASSPSQSTPPPATSQGTPSPKVRGTPSPKVRGTPPSKNDEWYTMDYANDQIRIASRICFNYDYTMVLLTDQTPISRILTPLRLILILIVTSALIAVLDLSVKIAISGRSLIQSCIHNILQVAFWSTILTLMEKFRRSWSSRWIEEAIDLGDGTPIFPTRWLVFEMLAFSLILVSILDFLLFKCSTHRLRLENSQGVYKCIEIEMDEMGGKTNGSFRQVATDLD